MPFKWKSAGKHDVYIEIAEYFEKHIKAGIYSQGDKLPSVRIAAGDLGVNPNTVAKAYAKLESDGLVCALPKKGAFVTYSGADIPPAKENHLAEQEEAFRTIVEEMKTSGADRHSLIKIIEEVYGQND